MEFKADVKGDPAFPHRGIHKCALSDDGLWLHRGNSPGFSIPRGTTVTLVERSRLRVSLDGQSFNLTVKKFATFTDRLARDLATFLSGAGELPLATGYSMPWYLTAPCVLPLGIPVLTLGGVLPAVLGFVFMGLAFSVATKEHWSLPLRLAAITGVILAAYAIFLVALGGIALLSPTRH